MPCKLVVCASSLLVAQVAVAQPGAQPIEPPTIRKKSPMSTTERWGGGARVTGLSGIGALPGVNYGGEVAVHVRHDEIFVELGLGWWKPEHQYLLADTSQRTELALDVWTVRAGWASMQTPLRGWVLAEAGELAGTRGMPGVVTRMMTGDTPEARRWQALGGGLGVAWPMSDHARLFGMMEVAVPLNRGDVMLEGGPYAPDPLAARASAGLEFGWR